MIPIIKYYHVIISTFYLCTIFKKCVMLKQFEKRRCVMRLLRAIKCSIIFKHVKVYIL